MSKDQAVLVVLSVVLHIRDIFAAQFAEEGEGEEDIPNWVLESPFSFKDAKMLLRTWGKQLTPDKGPSDKPKEDKTGKGKTKAKSNSSKRRAKSPVLASDDVQPQ
jgi:hypothetical protein